MNCIRFPVALSNTYALVITVLNLALQCPTAKHQL